MKKIVGVVLMFVLARAVWAANLGSDNAFDPAYSGGWTNGSNGGFGFGAWQLTTSGPNAGFFIGNSTQNGDGADDGVVNGKPFDRDIGVVA